MDTRHLAKIFAALIGEGRNPAVIESLNHQISRELSQYGTLRKMPVQHIIVNVLEEEWRAANPEAYQNREFLTISVRGVILAFCDMSGRLND